MASWNRHLENYAMEIVKRINGDRLSEAFELVKFFLCALKRQIYELQFDR